LEDGSGVLETISIPSGGPAGPIDEATEASQRLPGE